MSAVLDIGVMSSYSMEDDAFTQEVTLDSLAIDLDRNYREIISAHDLDEIDVSELYTSLEGDDNIAVKVLKKAWSIIKGILSLVDNVISGLTNYIVGLMEWIAKRLTGNKSEIEAWKDARGDFKVAYELLVNKLDYDKTKVLDISRLETAKGDGKEIKSLKSHCKDVHKAIRSAEGYFSELADEHLSRLNKMHKVYSSYLSAMNKTNSPKEFMSAAREESVKLNEILNDKSYTDFLAKLTNKEIKTGLEKHDPFTAWSGNSKVRVGGSELGGCVKVIADNADPLLRMADIINAKKMDKVKAYLTDIEKGNANSTKRAEKLFNKTSSELVSSADMASLHSAVKPSGDMSKLMQDYVAACGVLWGYIANETKKTTSLNTRLMSALVRAVQK